MTLPRHLTRTTLALSALAFSCAAHPATASHCKVRSSVCGPCAAGMNYGSGGYGMGGYGMSGYGIGGYGMGLVPPSPPNGPAPPPPHGPAPPVVPPPPGTLGITYQQYSALIPDDKHPRVGMVNVYLPDTVKVSARGMNSTWTGESWRLETIGALVPHLPHIYPIEAIFVRDGCEVKEVRWVRLIMGRVVDLHW